MNRIFCFALLAVLLALSTTPTFSQAFYGSIVGTITDPTGGAAASAAVALTNISTGERRQALAGTSGEYQFLNLVPGIYRVEVEQRGFKSASRDNIEVTVSGTVRADVSMQLGEITQTVEVQATAPLLRTEDANLSQVVSTRAVEELPVNGRNILNLTALVPGVVPQGTTDGNAITGKNIFAAGNYQIGGGMANQGAVYYDGVPANSVLGNLVNMVPSPDAIAEFRVQTNSNNRIRPLPAGHQHLPDRAPISFMEARTSTSTPTNSTRLISRQCEQPASRIQAESVRSHRRANQKNKISSSPVRKPS